MSKTSNLSKENAKSVNRMFWKGVSLIVGQKVVKMNEKNKVALTIDPLDPEDEMRLVVEVVERMTSFFLKNYEKFIEDHADTPADPSTDPTDPTDPTYYLIDQSYKLCYLLFYKQDKTKEKKIKKMLNNIPKFKNHYLLKQGNKSDSKKEKRLKPDSMKIRRTSIPYFLANDGWLKRDTDSDAQAKDYLMVESSSSRSRNYPPRPRSPSHRSESSSHLNESGFSDQSQLSDELRSSTLSFNESLEDFQENFSHLKPEDQRNFLFRILANQFPWEKKIDDYEFKELMKSFKPSYSSGLLCKFD
jgi:hypothetical protein